MKRYLIPISLLVLLFLLVIYSMREPHAQNIPTPANPLFCNQTAFYDASTNGSTKLASGITGKLTYICGWTLWAAGTANVKFIEGTGTNCATGTITLTPAYQLVTHVGPSDESFQWRGLSTVIAGDDLCINSSAGVAVQAQIYYTQL